MTEFILKQDGIHPDVYEMEGDLDKIPVEAFLTINEIVVDLSKNRISEEDKKALMEQDPVNRLYLLHHSLGTYIRNSYGLWLENCPLTDQSTAYIINGIDHNPKHPDAVSSVIIEKVFGAFKTLTPSGNFEEDFDRAMKTITENKNDT